MPVATGAAVPAADAWNERTRPARTPLSSTSAPKTANRLLLMRARAHPSRPPLAGSLTHTPEGGSHVTPSFAATQTHQRAAAYLAVPRR